MALYGGPNMFEPTRHEPDEAAVRTAPSLETGPRPGQRLPLQALVDKSEHGVSIRVPVRAERVWVEKEAFVYEEVVVHERRVEETVRATGSVRREELRLDTRGDLDVTQPIPLPAEGPAGPRPRRPRR